LLLLRFECAIRSLPFAVLLDRSLGRLGYLRLPWQTHMMPVVFSTSSAWDGKHVVMYDI
jgi:hypothetical protein